MILWRNICIISFMCAKLLVGLLNLVLPVTLTAANDGPDDESDRGETGKDDAEDLPPAHFVLDSDTSWCTHVDGEGDLAILIVKCGDEVAKEGIT